MGAIIYKLGALAILLLSGRTILKSSSDDNDGHTDNGKNDQGGDVDLTVIEGIGPKIKEILNNGGIHSCADLAKASFDDLREMLVSAGSRYRQHDPTTWPKQADLAARGKTDELAALKEELKAGRES